MFGENLQEQMILSGQPQTTGGCVQIVFCVCSVRVFTSV